MIPFFSLSPWRGGKLLYSTPQKNHIERQYGTVISGACCNGCMLQVFMFEVACDGVQLHKNYTVNMYVLRSRDARPNLAARTQNVRPLLIVPGPRDPKHYEVFNALVLEVFVLLGKDSGTSAA